MSFITNRIHLVEIVSESFLKKFCFCLDVLNIQCKRNLYVTYIKNTHSSNFQCYLVFIDIKPDVLKKVTCLFILYI